MIEISVSLKFWNACNTRAHMRLELGTLIALIVAHLRLAYRY